MFNAARRHFLRIFGLTSAATAAAGATGVASLAQASPLSADDARRLASLQLMQGSPLAKNLALTEIGLDWKNEQRQLADEEKRLAEAQAEMQAAMASQRRLDIEYLDGLEARLLADAPNYFGTAIDIPFATLPCGQANLMKDKLVSFGRDAKIKECAGAMTVTVESL